jgi:hypothetical protein
MEICAQRSKKGTGRRKMFNDYKVQQGRRFALIA